MGSVLDSLRYTTSAVDPDKDPVKFTFNWGDGYTSETGLTSSGAGAASHTWSSAGTYRVTAKATDNKGASSPVSEALLVTIASANRLPLKPAKPLGTAAGILQKSYSYTASAIDPDGDDVQITFDWGDGSTSKTDLVNSGTTVRMPHTWSYAGTYSVKVMAKDSNDAESLWSATKTVTVSEASRRSKAKLSSAAKAEETGQGKRTCPCSQKS